MIPRPLDAFIGRERELGELARLLSAGARCVTLLGPGGIGKTRLALELAQASTRERAAAIFVDLSEALSATDVKSALAAALATPHDTPAALGEALSARPDRLLVLDNAEQVAGELAALLAALLPIASSTQALVTSRQPLGLPGETPFELGPLASSTGAEATTLLLERASRIAPRATLDRELADRIAAAVDGLPLAIELSAARLNVLDAAELVERLERGAVALGDGTRDRRHSTLRACLEWSLERASQSELAALSMLSTFAGSFSAALGEAVIAELGDDAPLDRLHALKHQSLLVGSTEGFRLLKPIRDLVREALKPGEREQRALVRVLARHATELASALNGPEAGAALERLAKQRANLEAALIAFRELSRSEPLVEPELALALISALERTTRERGPSGLLPELARSLLALPSFVEWPQASKLAAFVIAARAQLRAGELAHARELVETARAHAGEGDGELVLIDAVDGSLLYAEGRVDLARDRFASALLRAERASEVEVEAPRAELLSSLAVAHHVLGDMQRAGETYAAALAALGDRAMPRVEAELRARRGFFAYDLGDLEAAEQELARGSELFASLGAELRASRLAGYRGNVARSRGDHALADDFYQRAIAGMRMAGDRMYAAVFSMDRGILRLLERRFAKAEAELEAALALSDAMGSARVSALILGYLALATSLRSERAETTALLERARELSASDPLLAELTRLQAAHVAWLRQAEAHPPPELRALVEQARGARFEHLRLAARLVDLSALEQSPPLGTVVIELTEEGGEIARLRDPRGEWHDLSKRESARRILGAVVEARGATVATEALIAAGWPGEKVLPSAGRNRLRVAITFLRGLGLEQALRSTQGGYALAGEVVVRLREA